MTDGISPKPKQDLEKHFIVDDKKGINPDELKKVIGDYNAIIIRSATKLPADVVEKADSMEIIGRAGIGVDNVDLDAATKKGIMVVNAPTSNAVTVAEHTIGLLLAVARKIPLADTLS
ncbi:MAG: hypothetical protein U5N58_04470 [Actinomycetota bacterium]|nr:hypothetical protein [Actinomycetota bacterium]